MIIALGLFLGSLIGKSEDLKRASLVIFFGLGLITIPTYMSGNAAQESLCKVDPTRPETPCPDAKVSRAAIETHRNAALLGFVFMEITGALAWLGLWQYRRLSRVRGGTLVAVLVLSIATLGLMANAANIGGGIRHPEILSGPQVNGTQGTVGLGVDGAAIGKFVRGVPWMWPTCETLHFVGLSLLLGVVLAVDLRMLGFMKNVSFATLHRLLPWGILGFGINVMTGMLFFVGAPDQYTMNKAFQWKIILVLLAAVNGLYFTVIDETWVLGPGDEAPTMAKVMAGSAMLLWVAIMFCGSMLPFLGNSF
jgi:hypothetical protein